MFKGWKEMDDTSAVLFGGEIEKAEYQQGGAAKL
jgi:hypothetical protein